MNFKLLHSGFVTGQLCWNVIVSMLKFVRSPATPRSHSPLVSAQVSQCQGLNNFWWIAGTRNIPVQNSLSTHAKVLMNLKL